MNGDLLTHVRKKLDRKEKDMSSREKWKRKTHTVTLTATCSAGSKTHTFNIIVGEPNPGLDEQYGYEESI